MLHIKFQGKKIELEETLDSIKIGGIFFFCKKKLQIVLQSGTLNFKLKFDLAVLGLKGLNLSSLRTFKMYYHKKLAQDAY